MPEVTPNTPESADLFKTDSFKSRDRKAPQYPVMPPALKPSETPDELNQRMLDRAKDLFRQGMLLKRSRTNHPLFQTAVLQVPHDKERSCSIAVLEAAISELDNLLSSDDPHFIEAFLDTRVGILAILSQVNDFTNNYKDPHAAIEILPFMAQPISDESGKRTDLDAIEWVNDSADAASSAVPDRKTLLTRRMQGFEMLKDVALGTQSFEQLHALFVSRGETKVIDQLSIGYFRAAGALHLRDGIRAEWYRILMVSLLESSRALIEKKSERFSDLVASVNAVAAKIALAASPNELAQAIDDFKDKRLPELLR